jgi:DNA-binding NtrC family response regulator
MRTTTPETVVLAGVWVIDQAALDDLAAEFGWSVARVSSICQLADMKADGNLAAVLFNPQGLGLTKLGLTWESALQAVRQAAPGALPIVCHGFADTVDWPQLAEAGAFHLLRMPFHLSEVRQSLGFVREATRRLAAPAMEAPADDLSRLRKAVRCKDREEAARDHIRGRSQVAR